MICYRTAKCKGAPSSNNNISHLGKWVTVRDYCTFNNKVFVTTMLKCTPSLHLIASCENISHLNNYAL